MSDMLRVPEPRGVAAPSDPARTLDLLATTIFVVLTIAVLFLAREILVPIAIAVLLSFVLSPPVRALRSIGIGKTFAVGIVVFSGFLIAVGSGAMLAKQVSDLAADAPRYQATMMAKVSALQAFATTNPLLAKVNATIAEVSHMAPAPAPKANPPAESPGSIIANPKAPEAAGDTRRAPVPVEIVRPAPGVLTILQAVAGTAASPLATAAFVAIFIVFILMQREDLRNRFIRLVGFGDLQRTTLAMNDAAKRLSRYFLAQVLLNTGFGVVVAGALALVGVPGAILWGIVASLMRFIPYIGSIGAAVFPMMMAAAAGAGWSMVVETAVLFVALEALVGQVVEPMVYGHRTGISPIAVVVAATFWTWLWGPIGLVLSTPLTVCLVVMGRHVDRLTFLDVIFGDAPALSPVEAFYQRMLVGDPSEIADHADRFLADHTLLEYCDQVAMPALLMAQADVRRGVLDDKRQTRVRDTMRDLVSDLDDQDDALRTAVAGDRPGALDGDGPDDRPMLRSSDVDGDWTHPRAVLCVAGRTPLDEAAARLLSDLLKRRGIGAEVEAHGSLMDDHFVDLIGTEIKLVMLSFLDADLRVAQARYAVRRLRRRLPGVEIVAAFWMAEADGSRTTGLCSDVRCDKCVASLPEAIALCVDRAEGGGRPSPDDDRSGHDSEPERRDVPVDAVA